MSEITNPNFCNFVKDINLYIQEPQQTLREINVKKNMSRLIKVKILEIKDKQNVLE